MRDNNDSLVIGSYHGDDFVADIQKMADDPITKKWCGPSVSPVNHQCEDSCKRGEHWSMMEEVFYHDPS